MSSKYSELSREDLEAMMESRDEVIAAQEKENKRLHDGWSRANDKVIELTSKLRDATDRKM